MKSFNMKSFKRGEKGFTLIELLIVVAILGVLAAVVIPNVVGLMGRGGKQAYQTDAEVIQLATSTFFSDVHGGWNSGASLWGDTGMGNVTNHYYPCALPAQNQPYLTISTTQFDAAPQNTNPLLLQSAGGAAGNDTDVTNSAIWMGLLVNAPGDGVASGGYNTAPIRVGVSALGNDTGLYLQRLPKSASTAYNGNTGTGGGYTWIVGRNGTVYGAYQPGGPGTNWYVGFSGSYP